MAKNVLQKQWNGSEWVEIHPFTKATNVIGEGGISVAAQLADMTQEVRNLPVMSLYRNAIINGNFDIWQRGTSFNTGGYNADRWQVTLASGLSCTVTRQQFQNGQSIVPCEPAYFARYTFSGTPGGGWWISQRVEDVRTFAGQKVTLSFWIKANTNMLYAGAAIEQRFGTGGSATVTNSRTYNVSTQWTKVSLVFHLANISGKTIGTNSFIDVRLFNVSGAAYVGTIDIAQVQLSAGEIDLPYQPRSFAEELMLCQRYYEKSYPVSTAPETVAAVGSSVFQTRTAINASTSGYLYPGPITFRVIKRVSPTIILYSPDTGAVNAIRNATSSNDRTGVTADLISDKAIVRLVVDATSLNAIIVDNVIRFNWAADAEL